MVTRAKNQLYTKIPVKVAEKEFNEFFLEHLSQPMRGPKCKLRYFKIPNYILKVLYTGMQQKEYRRVKCIAAGTACTGWPELRRAKKR